MKPPYVFPLPPEFQFMAYRRPPALPKDAQGILAMSDADIDAWDVAAKEVDHHNYQVAQPHNRKVDEAWKALLGHMGVEVEGARGGTPAHVRRVMEEMRVKAGVRGIPDRCLGYMSYYKWPLPPQYKEWAATNGRNSLREIVQYVRHVNALEAKKQAEKNATTKHWLARGPELGMHVASYATVEEYVEAVSKADRALYEKSMEGETLKIDQCDNCSSWTVGDHRCSCHNVRFYLHVEWDAKNLEWYGYPQNW